MELGEVAHARLLADLLGAPPQEVPEHRDVLPEAPEHQERAVFGPVRTLEEAWVEIEPR